MNAIRKYRICEYFNFLYLFTPFNPFPLLPSGIDISRST